MTDTELLAYLDEALPPAEMARLEQTLRTDASLRQRLTMLAHERDGGGHSLGEIWRRHRLSCPGRAKLGTYLLDALDDATAAYVRFHLDVIGCRPCQANLADLQAQQAAAEPQAVVTRRSRYFQSSAGRLPPA